MKGGGGGGGGLEEPRRAGHKEGMRQERRPSAARVLVWVRGTSKKASRGSIGGMGKRGTNAECVFFSPSTLSKPTPQAHPRPRHNVAHTMEAPARCRRRVAVVNVVFARGS